MKSVKKSKKHGSNESRRLPLAVAGCYALCPPAGRRLACKTSLICLLLRLRRKGRGAAAMDDDDEAEEWETARVRRDQQEMADAMGPQGRGAAAMGRRRG